MATRLFKRETVKDVFDQVDEYELPDTDEVIAPADDAELAVDAAEVADESSESDEPEPAEAPDGKEAPATLSARRRWTYRALVGSAVVVFVAAVGLSAFLGWQHKQHNDVTNAGNAALDTAKSYAIALTSIDANGIDDNFAQVLNGATGQFKDMYSQSATQLRQVLVDNKATSKGTVVDAAVKSASKDRVEVLLFIDQAITNVANPDPRLDRSRIDMTMELVDGRWLASNVELK
jgi:Mce-associated membrane protein